MSCRDDSAAEAAEPPRPERQGLRRFVYTPLR